MVVDWMQLSIGAALCIFGWVLYWVGLHLTGAIIGGAGAGFLGYGISSAVDLPQDQVTWVTGIAAAVGFIVGIFVFRGLHRLFFFIVGALLGVGIGLTLSDYGLTQWEWMSENTLMWRLLFSVGGAIVLGLLMVWGSRWIVVTVTAVVGAALIVLSIQGEPLVLLAFIPIALASFFLQTGILGKIGVSKPGRESEERK